MISLGLKFAIAFELTMSLPRSFSLIALKLMASIFNYNFHQGRLKKILGAYDLILQFTLSYLVLIRIH